MAVSNLVSRRDVFAGGLAAIGVATMDRLAHGYPVRGPQLESGHAPQFASVVSVPLTLSGRVLRSQRSDCPQGVIASPRFILHTDRVTGYIPVALAGTESVYGPIADSPNPFVRVTGRLRNDLNTPIPIFDPLADPQPSALEPLPDFESPVSLTSEEMITANKFYMAFGEAVLANPNCFFDTALLDQVAIAFPADLADPDIRYRFASLPMVAYRPDSCTLVGLSLWNAWPRPEGDEPEDLLACVLSIVALLITFLFNLIIPVLTPATQNAIRAQAQVVANAVPGINGAVQAVITVVQAYRAGTQPLSAVIAAIVNVFRLCAGPLGGAVWAVLTQAGISWWQWAAAAARASSALVTAVSAILNATSLALAIISVVTSCLEPEGRAVQSRRLPQVATAGRAVSGG